MSPAITRHNDGSRRNENASANHVQQRKGNQSNSDRERGKLSIPALPKDHDQNNRRRVTTTRTMNNQNTPRAERRSDSRNHTDERADQSRSYRQESEKGILNARVPKRSLKNFEQDGLNKIARIQSQVITGNGQNSSGVAEENEIQSSSTNNDGYHGTVHGEELNQNHRITDPGSYTPLLSRRSQRKMNTESGGPFNGVKNVRSTIRAGSADRTVSQTPNTFESLLPIFNQTKTKLLETQRDKRVYASTVLNQQDKLERLARQLRDKDLQILGLEESLAKKGAKTNRKGNIWSQKSLSADGIGEYQGICLALGRVGSTEVNYLITESFIEPSRNQIRRRDWRSSLTGVPSEVAKRGIQFVTLPDGTQAIPTSVMLRAQEVRFFDNIFKSPSGFLRECLTKVLSSPAASFMTEEEKNQCHSRIASHRPTNQKFRAMLSDGVGNRKKISRNTYLRSLGYINAIKPFSKNDSTTVKELRESEKEKALSRCVSILPSGYPDTSHWRTTDWKILCLDASDHDITADMENNLESNEGVDCWFLNEASKRAFLELKGYPALENIDGSINDSSLLTLARADAAMTTMMKLITVGGKGGVRNNSFVGSLRELLPIAMEVIIKELWMDISDRAEHELYPFIGNSQDSEDDPYGNSLGDYTVVQVNPDDDHVYVLASSKYIEEKICSWYGSIKDAHIGRCKKSDRCFTVIDKHMRFTDDEESDIDALPYEEITGAEIEDGSTPEVSQ